MGVKDLIPLVGLGSAALKLKQQADPAYELRSKFDVNEAISHIKAYKQLRRQLVELRKQKLANPTATNTGGVMGKWRTTSSFEGAEEKAPSMINNLINIMVPKKVYNARNKFEKEVKGLPQTAQIFSGKTMSGFELSSRMGPLPGMYDDEEAFVNAATDGIDRGIPGSVADIRDLMIDLNFPEKVIRRVMRAK